MEIFSILLSILCISVILYIYLNREQGNLTALIYAFIFILISFLTAALCLYIVDIRNIFILIFIFMMIALCIVDLIELKVPAVFLILFLICGVILGFLNGFLIEGFILCGITSIIKIIYETYRAKEVLGNGDILFLAGFGSVFGMELGLWSIFIGSLLSAIYISFKFVYYYKIKGREIGFNVPLPFFVVCFIGFIVALCLFDSIYWL